METQENSVAFSLFLSPRFGKTLYRMLFNRASRSIAKTCFFGGILEGSSRGIFCDFLGFRGPRGGLFGGLFVRVDDFF